MVLKLDKYTQKYKIITIENNYQNPFGSTPSNNRKNGPANGTQQAHYLSLSFILLLLTSSSGRSGSKCVKLCRTTGLRSSTTSSLTPSQMFRTFHDESNISTSCADLTLCASVCVPGRKTMGARAAESRSHCDGSGIFFFTVLSR